MINQICKNPQMSQVEKLQSIFKAPPLEVQQREFIQMQPPTNLDVCPYDVPDLNKLLPHSKNTTCIACSKTGVLSNKQTAIQAAGSVVAFDPDQYDVWDHASNFLIRK